MSFERVREYFERQGMRDCIKELENIDGKVDKAALALGCEPERIAKGMCFLVAGQPVLIVIAGDAKINNAKFKSFFDQRPAMIPGDQLKELVGHIPGAVCPFVLNDGVRVFLDESLKRFDSVYTAGGSLESMIALSLEELKEHSAFADWVDVCHGWHG